MAAREHAHENLATDVVLTDDHASDLGIQSFDDGRRVVECDR
jgi:hypothetical protein